MRMTRRGFMGLMSALGAAVVAPRLPDLVKQAEAAVAPAAPAAEGFLFEQGIHDSVLFRSNMMEVVSISAQARAPGVVTQVVTARTPRGEGQVSSGPLLFGDSRDEREQTMEVSFELIEPSGLQLGDRFTFEVGHAGGGSAGGMLSTSDIDLAALPENGGERKELRATQFVASTRYERFVAESLDGQEEDAYGDLRRLPFPDWRTL